LDFADEDARAVIMLGVPFPSFHDTMVKLKIEYLDRKKTNLREKGRILMDGNTWYRQQATRATNQSVGRIIRNKNDYGAIIMMDERYGWKNIQNEFSKWIKDSLVTYDSFGPQYASVVKFFKERKADAERNPHIEEERKKLRIKKPTPPMLEISTRPKIHSPIPKPLAEGANRIEKYFGASRKDVTPKKKYEDKNIGEKRKRVITDSVEKEPQKTKPEAIKETLETVQSQGSGDILNKVNDFKHRIQKLLKREQFQYFTRTLKQLRSRDYASIRQIASQMIDVFFSEGVHDPPKLRTLPQYDEKKQLLLDTASFISGEKDEYLETINAFIKKAETAENFDTLLNDTPISPRGVSLAEYDLVTNASAQMEPALSGSQQATRLKKRIQLGSVMINYESLKKDEISGSHNSSKSNQVLSQNGKSSNSISQDNPHSGGLGCMICLENSISKPNYVFLTTKCGHIACNDCWESWLSTKLECPMCKQRTRMKQLIKLNI